MPYTILVASYSSVITTLSFDPSTSPPSISVVSTTPSAKNPSWISAHPTDKTVVYAGIELKEGKVQVFKIVDAEKGKLEFVEEVESGGAGVAHLVASETELVVGNYSGGTALPIPLSPTTHYPTKPIQPPIVFPFGGPGPLAARQESPHPHQVIFHPTREELLIPDLGNDKIWRLLKDGEGKWEIKGSIDFTPGSGPRHAIIYEDTLYTVLELSKQIAAHTLPPLPAPATFITSLPTLTPPAQPLPDMLAAELILSTNPTPLLYLSNRNDPSPLGDSVSIYSISPSLTQVNEVRTGSKHLRGMIFVGEGDKYILLAGQNGGGVKVYERINEGKDLKEVAALAEDKVEKPTGFLWIA